VQKYGGSKEEQWSSLMRMALAGDQLAYQRLLLAVAPHIRGVARRCLPQAGSADVEDIVQETLLAVHLKRTTWDPSLPFLPWLNAVARHKAIDAIRRKGGRIEVEIDDVGNELIAPDGGGESSLDARVMLALPPGT
jgi:RNA polymerase sigma-70 factor, ECF subfamily